MRKATGIFIWIKQSINLNEALRIINKAMKLMAHTLTPIYLKYQQDLGEKSVEIIVETQQVK